MSSGAPQAHRGTTNTAPKELPMTTTDINSLTDDTVVTAPAATLVRALRDQTISSRELLQAFLDRVEVVNPSINAVVTLDAERAMEAAARADDETARGQAVGALHGLPVTIKDSLETVGLRTTAGHPDLAGHVPTADADAVARLRAQGAIIFGKT